jgi:uncharacterized OB-fold protein
MADEPRPTKPIPEPDDESRPFFEGALEGKLMMMRCASCRAYRLPSRTHCDQCLSSDFTWEQVSGRGTLRTFAIMHQRYHPAFADELPYNVATVELEEGPRIATNIVGVANDALVVGMPVVVAWERYDDVALPRFRPV